MRRLQEIGCNSHTVLATVKVGKRDRQYISLGLDFGLPLAAFF